MPDNESHVVLTRDTRCTGIQRERAVSLLQEAISNGSLPHGQGLIRIEKALEAATEENLRRLVSDLPSTSPPVRRRDWVIRGVLLPITLWLATGLIPAGLLTAGVLNGASQAHSPGSTSAEMLFGFITGLGWLFISIAFWVDIFTDVRRAAKNMAVRKAARSSQL